MIAELQKFANNISINIEPIINIIAGRLAYCGQEAKAGIPPGLLLRMTEQTEKDQSIL